MARLLSIFVRNFTFYCAGFFLFYLLTQTEAQCPGGADEMKALHKKLLEDYNPSVRPSRNYSSHIFVSMQLYVSVIMGLDTKKQLLYLRAFLRVNWIDDYLQWEPKDHGYINHITLPQNSVWKPDIILHNAANEHDNLGNERLLVFVNSKGVVKWDPPFYLEGTCKLDMTKYPFDVSRCPVVVASWTMDNESMVLTSPEEPVNIRNMVINGEYEVSSGGVHKDILQFDDIFFEVMNFNIRLARRPLYIVISLFVPVNLLAILGILSFLMLPEEPEKIGISITIMLSFTVFLAFIDNNIPPTSDNVSLLVIYVSGQLVLSFLTVVGNVIVVSIKTGDIENDLKQHSASAISYKNTAQGNPKIHKCLLETYNYDTLSSNPSRPQIIVTEESKHQIFNNRASRLNNVFLIISCVIFGLISCLLLIIIL